MLRFSDSATEYVPVVYGIVNGPNAEPLLIVVRNESICSLSG
jgi:hypothetical protein